MTTTTDTIIHSKKDDQTYAIPLHTEEKTQQKCGEKKEKKKMCDNNVTLAEIFRKVIHSKSSLHACFFLFLFSFSRLFLFRFAFFSSLFLCFDPSFAPFRVPYTANVFGCCVSCAFVCVTNK